MSDISARYNNSIKPLICLAAMILFFLVLFVPAHAQGARVDARVMEDTANGGVGQFLVIFKSQAQTRALAAAYPDRVTRGRAVFDALRQTANGTQIPVRSLLDAQRVKYRSYFIVNMLAVEGGREIVEMLAAQSDVLAIESDRAFHIPLEPAGEPTPKSPTGIEWNIAQIDAPTVWARGFTGQGITFANGDTGVQWDHPALKLQYRGWKKTSVNHNHNWWDAIHVQINPSGNICGYNLAAPCDDYGHGTHTMGIGVGDDGVGDQIGVAPGAEWIACRNMDNGVGRPSTYIECFQFFLAPTDLVGNDPNPDLRPDVVSNSYTCPPSELCSADSLAAAVDNLRAAGVFMSASAGNDGSSCFTITEPPAIYSSVITVGATDSGDNIAGFSSRGPVARADGSYLQKPDLTAPGVNVRSSVPGNAFAAKSGTSMSAPHVAGAVALLWSAFPSLRHNIDYTESVLKRTAIQKTTGQACGQDTPWQYPNNVYGYGRIDVSAAYDYINHPGLSPFSFFLPLIGR